MTATSLSAIRDSASVTPARVATAGPVRFFSQPTMSSACLPAATQQNTITQALLYVQTSRDWSLTTEINMHTVISFMHIKEGENIFLSSWADQRDRSYGGPEGQNTTTFHETLRHFTKHRDISQNTTAFHKKSWHFTNLISWNVGAFPEMSSRFLKCCCVLTLNATIRSGHTWPQLKYFRASGVWMFKWISTVSTQVKLNIRRYRHTLPTFYGVKV